MLRTTLFAVAFAVSGIGTAEAFAVRFSWAGTQPCTSVSPAFTVSAAPKGTTQLKLVMTDLDVPTYNHGGGTVAWSSGAVAAGSISSWGYRGPCPPPGPAHRYQWTVEAMDASGKVLGTARTMQPFQRP
jgi:phosphatidylethanolamine-binding protein (PEBP) family uncharacterized protein